MLFRVVSRAAFQVSGRRIMKSVSPSLSTAVNHTVRERLREVLAVPEASTVSTENKIQSLCQYYRGLIPEDKGIFMEVLCSDYSVNHSAVLHLATQLTAVQDRGSQVVLRSEERLRQALVPKYQQLFTQISRQENGVKFLVDFRRDLLMALSVEASNSERSAQLQALSSCLRELLSLWFSVGFLQLEKVTWQSPGDMLQKISEYEAVHPIRNWTDLMRRVGPYRRCYVFMHASMPREPVVVLHTALTDGISRSIQSIVSRSRDADVTDVKPDSTTEDTSYINSAIFYSITSTQKGLQGVEMGNYLIKSVVQQLLTEFPSMSQFSSLSPIPGFKDWLLKEINRHIHQYEAGEHPEQHLLSADELSALEEALGCTSKTVFDQLRRVLQSNSWVQDQRTVQCLEQPLLRLCARYLFVEKRRQYALNPVANFHLRNGAVLWRLNWLGDASPRGLGASCGLMVNYRYYLEQTEHNSKNYMENFVIPVSESVQSLIDDFFKLTP